MRDFGAHSWAQYSRTQCGFQAREYELRRRKRRVERLAGIVIRNSCYIKLVIALEREKLLFTFSRSMNGKPGTCDGCG